MSEKPASPPSSEPEPEQKTPKGHEPTEKGTGYWSGVDAPDEATDDAGS